MEDLESALYNVGRLNRLKHLSTRLFLSSGIVYGPAFSAYGGHFEHVAVT